MKIVYPSAKQAGTSCTIRLKHTLVYHRVLKHPLTINYDRVILLYSKSPEKMPQH